MAEYVKVPMYVISNDCPLCGQGLIGFFTCHDGRIILMCDECELIWLNPECFKANISTRAINSLIRETNSCIEESSHWSTKEEIVAVGWESCIEEEIMIKVKKPK